MAGAFETFTARHGSKKYSPGVYEPRPKKANAMEGFYLGRALFTRRALSVDELSLFATRADVESRTTVRPRRT
jgi:hypothetical protein